jgi:hypothetical protein
MGDVKHFTLEEANKALPVVSRAVSGIQEGLKWLATHRPEGIYLVPEFKIPNETPVNPEYFSRLIGVRDALCEVTSLGCQIKDIQMGLVDFPARLSGREVLLCWRAGEEAIEYYHDLESGYSGRRAIPEGAFDDNSGDETGGRHS